MSDVTLHDKARAAIALLVAEHGGIPAQALLEIAWLHGYAAGINRGAELADKIIREELG